jgi:hypothetical protein
MSLPRITLFSNCKQAIFFKPDSTDSFQIGTDLKELELFPILFVIILHQKVSNSFAFHTAFIITHWFRKYVYQTNA